MVCGGQVNELESTVLKWHVPVPEGLTDGVAAQVDDLNQVVPGAGEQLGAVVVQVKRCDSAQELQLTDNTLRSKKIKKITWIPRRRKLKNYNSVTRGGHSLEHTVAKGVYWTLM